jgi:DNA-directed RNA polymerase subunit F
MAGCLPMAGIWMYLEIVSKLEAIVEDLKSLPPDKLEAAADFIRQLKPVSLEEHRAALDRTFGCLTKEEADELEKVIEEGCEQVNEHGW